MGSPTPYSNPSSCVADPCAAVPLHSWPPALRTPPNASDTRCSSPGYRAAQSTSWPHWLPAWSHRCRPSCPSAIPLVLLAVAPSETLPDEWPRPSADVCARWSHGLASARPARSARTAANTGSLPLATRFPVHSRSPRRSRSASPGNTSPVRATGGPASRDRTCCSAFHRTRRTLPAPALRSIVDKKDAPELPPDRGDTKAPLVADAACVFPSPWQDTTLNHSRCKVINHELLTST